MRPLRQLLVVCERELRETSRDTHAVAFLLVPLFAWPVLLWATSQVMLVSEGFADSRDPRIDVTGPPELVELARGDGPVVDGGLEALRAGDLDLVVRATTAGDQWDVVIDQVGVWGPSTTARARLEEQLDTLRAEREAVFRQRAGVPPPLTVEDELVGNRRQVIDRAAGLLIALVVPMALVMSAIYPAIDAVVGERERKTVETTLVTAVPRDVSWAGRLLSLTVLCGGAGVLNLGGVLLTLSQLVVMKRPELGVWWTAGSSLALVPAIAASALMVSAWFLLLLAPARTFKEGEYLGSTILSAMLVPPFFALSHLLEGLEPTFERWLPLANLAALGGQVARGTAGAGDVAAVVAVNLAVAAPALLAGRALARSEDWTFGDAGQRLLARLGRRAP